MGNKTKQKQIDDLEEQEKNESDSYDKRIEAIKDAQEKRKEIEEKANEDSLKEKKAYAKADKLIMENHQQEMLKLLASQSESYKEIGS